MPVKPPATGWRFINFQLTPDQLDWLDRRSQVTGNSRGAVIRSMLAEAMEAEQQEAAA